MTDYNRAVAVLGEYSDEGHNANGEAVTPGRNVTGIAPASIVMAVATPVSVNGTGFVDGNDVLVDGAAQATTFVSSTQLRATITRPAAGTATVGVAGASGTATLTVTAAQGERATQAKAKAEPNE